MLNDEIIDPADARQIVENFTNARNNSDKATITETLTDDIEYVLPLSVSAPIKGLNEVSECLCGVTLKSKLKPGMKRTIKRMIVSGNIVSVEQYNGGVTLNGHQYSNETLWIYEFRGKKIFKIIEYADTLWAFRIFEWPKTFG
jgi:ketosteroid isomerase-like protein